jgi:hypothetical protein
MTRRGMTLAEAVIAFGIAVLIAGIVSAALTLSRRGERVAERDAALEALVLAQEQLSADLRCLAVAPGASPLGFDAEARAAGFWTWAADGALAPVIYRVDGAGRDRRLVRAGAGRASPVGMGLVRAVRFALFDTPVGKMVRVTLEAEAAGTLRTATFAHRLRAPMGREAQGIVFRPSSPFPDKDLDPAAARPRFRIPSAGLPRPLERGP